MPTPLRWFLAVTASLTALCVAVETLCRFSLGLQYPYTWPLMPTTGLFFDFALYEDRFRLFHSPAFYAFDGPGYYYPAPMAVVHWLLLQLPFATETFLALLSAAFVLASCLFARALSRRGLSSPAAAFFVASAAVCSYPFFFEFEQANLDWLLCALVVAGIWSFLRGHGFAAAICFGLAGSMKFYPIVLVGLFLARRQYRETLASLAAAALSMVVGLWLACPDLPVSWRGMQQGLAGFRDSYVLRYEQVGFDHSLFAAVKALALLTTGRPLSQPALVALLGIYIPAVTFAVVLLYFAAIRKLPVVNQTLCLTILMILLPPVSYDYTLLHLYAPWALLVLVAIASRNRLIPGLTPAFVCLAVSMAPLSEIIIHAQSYAGPIKASSLVALFVISQRFPFDLPDPGDLQTKEAGAR